MLAIVDWVVDLFDFGVGGWTRWFVGPGATAAEEVSGYAPGDGARGGWRCVFRAHWSFD